MKALVLAALAVALGQVGFTVAETFVLRRSLGSGLAVQAQALGDCPEGQAVQDCRLPAGRYAATATCAAGGAVANCHAATGFLAPAECSASVTENCYVPTGSPLLRPAALIDDAGAKRWDVSPAAYPAACLGYRADQAGTGREAATASGAYWIAPGGGGRIKAYCDFATDTGGWTLAYSLPSNAGLSGTLLRSTRMNTGNFGDLSLTFALAHSDFGAYTELRFWCQNGAGATADAAVSITSAVRTTLTGAVDSTFYQGSGIAIGTARRLPENTIWTSDFSAKLHQAGNSEYGMDAGAGSWGGYWAPYANQNTYSECNQSNNANDGSGRRWRMWFR